MKNRAFYMTGLKEMEMREIEMPVPAKGEVIVKLDYVGICGSDVHYLEHGRIGDFVVEGILYWVMNVQVKLYSLDQA